MRTKNYVAALVTTCAFAYVLWDTEFHGLNVGYGLFLVGTSFVLAIFVERRGWLKKWQ
jgi:hypothetical protein